MLKGGGSDISILKGWDTQKGGGLKIKGGNAHVRVPFVIVLVTQSNFNFT